jgi:large subunit ribosomal protein L21
MYAVIETGGKQYRVNEGDVVRVELLPDEVGSEVSIDAVSLVATADDVHVGTPHVAGAQVRAKVVEVGRGSKVIAFKKKRRKGYRRKIGHRQAFTALQIEEIVAPSASTKKAVSEPKAEAEDKPAKKAAPKKAAPKKAAPKKKAAKKKAAKKKTTKKKKKKSTKKKTTKKKAKKKAAKKKTKK